MAVSVTDTPKRPKRRFRLRGASKLAAGFLVIVGVLYAIWAYGIGTYLNGINYPAPVPGSVSLLALGEKAGYRIKIVDQIAQIWPASDTSFEASDANLGISGGGGKQTTLPLNELIGTLRGDSSSATQFVMVLNKLDAESSADQQDPELRWPNVQIPWTADQIQKALNGDAKLQSKLITDLNMKLDGTPLDQVSYRSLENGIIVQVPVTLRVTINGALKKIPIIISRPYRPSMIIKVMETVDKNPSMNFNSDKRLGTYVQFAKQVLSGDLAKENIKSTLQNMLNPSAYDSYLQQAEKVIDATTVVVSNSQIKSASDSPETIGNTQMYNLNLNMTSEGRLMLWKYSHFHHGDQLLLVSHGVAIAAPIIKGDLMTSDVTIGQMQDKNLVDDAVSSINGTNEASQ